MKAALIIKGTNDVRTDRWELRAGEKGKGKVVGVLGDSTFIHSGMTPLLNAAYNKSDAVFIICDNRTTAMTGMQEHPATGFTLQGQPAKILDFTKLAEALGIDDVQVVDPLDLDQLESALEQELNRREPSVIITKRPCVLIDKRPVTQKFIVDEELCKGCKICIKLGCTGISFVEEAKKAVITPSCIACGLCPQVCKFDAVKRVEG